MSSKKVFIIGPGFIGWNVLDLLVQEENKYNITALVRRKEHATAIESSGAKPVLGSLDDGDLITQQTIESELIIHTATADHKPSVEAVLKGVFQRSQEGKETIFIHTSGTSVLDDDCKGDFKGKEIYSDDDPTHINSVPDSAPHRQIDLTIVNALKKLGSNGKAKLAIMIPPLIYGFNPKHSRLSIQIPTLTRFARKHGFAGYIGKGLAVESQIHVLDLARAYIALLHHLENPNTKVDELIKNPYYFCENGQEFSWLEVAENIGRELHRHGQIKDPEPRPIPEDLWGDLFAEFTPAVIGLNSRSRAVKLRKELGWESKEKSLWESYTSDELPVILKEEDFTGFKGYTGTAVS